MAAAFSPGMHSMSSSRQKLLAGLGGVAATAVDVVALAALVENGCPVAPAAYLGATLGAAVSFTVSRRLAFRDRSPLTWSQLARFAAVAFAAAMTMAVAMHVTADLLGVPYLLAKALCGVAVFALWTFPAQRRYVFRAGPLGGRVLSVAAVSGASPSGR